MDRWCLFLPVVPLSAGPFDGVYILIFGHSAHPSVLTARTLGRMREETTAHQYAQLSKSVDLPRRAPPKIRGQVA